MMTRVRFDGFAIAMFAAAVGILAAPTPSASAKPQTGKQKTWMHSGKRYSLAALEGTGARPLAGKFSPFCSSKEVRSLAVQNDTLWVGTEGGLFACRVGDDTALPVAGPSSIAIRALAVDDAGALWVGGDYGLGVRSPRGWETYMKESLPFFGRVRCMVPGDKRFWIGTYGNGCGYVKGGTLAVLSAQDSLLDERVLSIVEETPDFVYFGTASGLISADSLGWKSLRYGSRLPIGSVNDMTLDEDGNLFLAIAGQGIAQFSFGRVRTFGTAQSPPGTDVRAFSLDQTGRVWAAGGSGVFIFDGTEWTACPAPGLTTKKYRYLSIHHDSEGTCYLGTDDGKVLVVSRDAVREIAVPQLFGDSRASRVRSAGGTVWAIAGRSIYSSKGSFVKAAAPPDLYAEEMTDIAPAESGELWVTTRFGILHFTGRAWEVFDRRNGLATEYFTRVAKDPAGKMWFTTFDGGIVTFASGTWTSYGRENGLPANAVDDLALDASGNPWIVTQSGEIAHFMQGSWTRMDLPRAAEKKPDSTGVPDSLSQFDPAIRFLGGVARGPAASSEMNEYCLGSDHGGNCPVGTSDGVYRLLTTGWQSLELPRRMRGTRATAVLGTAKGDIWLGTAGNGVFVYRNGEWIRLGASTGLTDDYIRSMCEDQKGTIWIGTQFGGITRFTPPNGT